MNYLNIHNKLVNYARTVTPRDRIRNRNKNDVRLNSVSLYVEVHHIIPRSLDGDDSKENLVELLPEEHIFIHMLRYKIYNKREDMLAVRFMLNGMSTRNHMKNQIFLTKKLRMGYSWIRTHSAEFRKEIGWQTEDGVRRISEARMGTMPVRDSVTREMIGSVSVDHPNVLSGKWVHHTKGIKYGQEVRDKISKRNKGQGNGNASGLTEEYFIQKGLEMYKEFGAILGWGTMLNLSEQRGFKWIKTLKSRFEGRAQKGYIEEMEKATGTKYKHNRKLCNKIKNDKN